MPKENKHSRGRRDEKKLKRKRDDEEEAPQLKKQKSQEPIDDVVITEIDNADVPLEEAEASERPFYGMLEDEEQEYFRRADELLELNDFPSEEERSIFLANVYKEADGKELKIACSQGCSRLMERLILLSSTAQKKKLFEKFAGNYPHLIQHRFASHCCETLFIQSAPVVTGELTADSKKKGEEDEVEEEKSMETLFLETLDELEGQMTFLLTDRFASHTLRVLLVILSGRPLEKSSTRTLMQSKKKEKITVTGFDNTPTELSLNKRAVPSSFEFAVEKIISDTIATMDTSFIRVLATHPTGNPTLQLLLELELSNPNSKKGSNSDQKTIISALLPDEITKEGSESQTFINGLLYEPIGSRLLETICTFAPGKLFKQVYRAVFKDRIAAIARNEISSYAAIRVLNRLSKEDLQEALDAIYPQIAGLIERKRTVIVKTLLERCQIRGLDSKKLVQSITEAYGNEPSSLILKMACIDDVEAFVKTQLTPPPTEEETAAAEQETAEKPKRRFPQAPPKTAPSQLHGSLLAQGMLAIPGPPAKLIQSSLLALPSSTLLALAMYTTTSHIIQAALLPINDVLFRRKFINLLLFASDAKVEHVQVLALSSTGSHVLDALLTSTTAPTPNSTSAPLFSLSERIANVLITHEFALRNSWSGRIVWRNWNMDLFKRRRGDWVNTVKAAGAEKASSLASSLPEPVVEHNGDENENVKAKKNDKKNQKGKGGRNGKGGAKPGDEGKSAIELAREKFAAAKANKIAMKDHRGTGVNASAVVGRS